MEQKRRLYAEPDALDASRRRALADIEAGRTVPHEDLATWLDTWGTDKEAPMPPEWLK